VEQGRYIALDAADTLSKFMVNGTPDPILFSELIGGPLFPEPLPPYAASIPEWLPMGKWSRYCGPKASTKRWFAWNNFEMI
jgi:hypothetical protein